MLILPGGGYEKCSNQEGAPVAGWLNSLGIAAFVLEYRVAPAKYPSPYHDARRAIQYIRHHAEKFNIDPNRVGVIGFSAGGHLAATLSNHYEMKNELLDDDIEQIDARPDISVLSYPVISWGDFRHQGSLDCLLGENPDAALQQMLSMEHAVQQNTP
ncbi:MAG: alpha/beta hydrolase, partial [Lentisphaeraceae bacterium]|nr:alpha/beta hydrolase [Lentisphaeraceae bacterium]